MKDGNELLASMGQFTGSMTLYRHPLVRRFTYTEGVRHFALNAGGGAVWLLDILATEPAIRNLVLGDGPDCGFASVRIFVEGTKGTITVDDGNGNVKFTRVLDYTDCPERPAARSQHDDAQGWLFFIEPNQLGDGTTCMTMMWPSER